MNVQDTLWKNAGNWYNFDKRFHMLRNYTRIKAVGIILQRSARQQDVQKLMQTFVVSYLALSVPLTGRCIGHFPGSME